MRSKPPTYAANSKTIYLNQFQYKCKMCPKAFHQSLNLQQHVRQIHVVGRPFQCHECDFSSKNTYQL